MFGDKIKLTELDNKIRELENQRQEIRDNLAKKVSYIQFVCCKKCKFPLFPVEQKSEYSEVEVALNKHDLECKGASNRSDYICGKCNRDLGGSFITDKDTPVYRFGDMIYCADCALAKKKKEEQELK